MTKLSALALWHRVAIEVRKQLRAHISEAGERKGRRFFHLLRNIIRRAAQHALGVLHDLGAEKDGVVRVGRHVGQQGHHNGFKRHYAAPQFRLRCLGHDFFSYAPVFVMSAGPAKGEVA